MSERLNAMVSDDVKKYLVQIQSQVINEIIDEVTRTIDTKYQSRIEELEREITLLSDKIFNKDGAISVDSSLAQKDNSSIKSSKSKLDEILSNTKFRRRIGEWIYYYKLPKKQKGIFWYGFLYRVHPDGSGNQKAIPVKIRLGSYNYNRSWKYKVFDIGGGCITFYDENGNERSLPHSV